MEDIKETVSTTELTEIPSNDSENPNEVEDIETISTDEPSPVLPSTENGGNQVILEVALTTVEKKDAEVQCEILAIEKQDLSEEVSLTVDIPTEVAKQDAGTQCEPINEENNVEADFLEDLKLQIQSLEVSLKKEQEENAAITENLQKTVMENEVSSTKTAQEYEKNLRESRTENSRLEGKVQVLEEKYQSAMAMYATAAAQYQDEKTRLIQEYERKICDERISKTKLEEVVKQREEAKKHGNEPNALNVNETKNTQEDDTEPEESNNDMTNMIPSNEEKQPENEGQTPIDSLEISAPEVMEENNQTFADFSKIVAEFEVLVAKAEEEHMERLKDLEAKNTDLEKKVIQLEEKTRQFVIKNKASETERNKLSVTIAMNQAEMQSKVEELQEVIRSLKEENQNTLNKYEKKLANMESSKESLIQNYEQQIKDLKKNQENFKRSSKDKEADSACFKIKTASTESIYEKKIVDVRMEMRERCELEIRGAEEAARQALVKKYEEMLAQVNNIKQEILITFTESVRNYELKISEIHIFYEQKLEALRQQKEDEQSAAAAKEIEALQNKCNDLEIHYKDIMDEMKNEMRENWENERREMEAKFEKEKEVLVEQSEKGEEEYEAKMNEISKAYEEKIAQMALDYSALEERYNAAIKQLEDVLEKMKMPMPVERSVTSHITAKQCLRCSGKETMERATNTESDGHFNLLKNESKLSFQIKENQNNHREKNEEKQDKNTVVIIKNEPIINAEDKSNARDNKDLNERDNLSDQESKDSAPLCDNNDTLNIKRETVIGSSKEEKASITNASNGDSCHGMKNEIIIKQVIHTSSCETRKRIPDFQKALNTLKEKQEIEELLKSLQNEICQEQFNFLQAMQFKKDGQFDDFSQSSAKRMVEEKINLETELKIVTQEILNLLEDNGLKKHSDKIAKKAKRKDEIELRLEIIEEGVNSEPMRAAEALTCLLETKAQCQQQLETLETTLKEIKKEIESELKHDARFVDVVPEKLIIDLCLSPYQAN